jgi:hypothetical protein
VLGINERLERKLRQHGKSAMATVLSIRRQRWAMYKIPDADVNPAAAAQDYKALWHMVIRVVPDGEPAFDATIDAWLGIHHRPSEGWLIPVLYDPSNHRDVVFDRSRLAQAAANQANYPRLVAKAQREFDELAGVETQAAEAPVERLSTLIDLHDRGLLTDAEFEAEKQKLLGR